MIMVTQWPCSVFSVLLLRHSSVIRGNISKTARWPSNENLALSDFALNSSQVAHKTP